MSLSDNFIKSSAFVERILEVTDAELVKDILGSAELSFFGRDPNNNEYQRSIYNNAIVKILIALGATEYRGGLFVSLAPNNRRNHPSFSPTPKDIPSSHKK